MASRIRAYIRENHLALLCLFLIVGGSTAYAANTIGSSDVIDNSLLSADLKNNNVRGADIATGSIAETDLATNAVPADGGTGTDGSTKLATNSVDWQEIAGSAVRGVQVDDGSLTGVDIKDDSLTEADIAAGAFPKASAVAAQANLATPKVLPWNLNPDKSLQVMMTRTVNATHASNDLVISNTSNFSGTTGSVYGCRLGIDTAPREGNFNWLSLNNARFLGESSADYEVNPVGFANNIPSGTHEVALICSTNNSTSQVKFHGGDMTVIAVPG